MHCTLSFDNPLSKLEARRTGVLVGFVVGIILAYDSVGSENPYCDKGSSSCWVTTEVMVDQPIPHGVEAPLVSSEVRVEGVPHWTEPSGLLQAECGDGQACEAKLLRSKLGVSDQCSNDVSTFSLSGNKPTYSCASDCSEPGDIESGGFTWAARTAFHWAGEAMRKAEVHGVDPAYIPSVVIETNHSAATHGSGADLVCAGFWDSSASTIEFFQSGGGCTNTGENPSIVTHEWGHALYDSLNSAPKDKTTNEAQADVHAALVMGDACIGRGVRPGERCAGCREGCTGLRDLGAFSLWSSHPVSAATLFTSDGPNCPLGTATSSGPMGAAPHCESLIASTAFMDMMQLLRVSEGEALGTEMAEKLFYKSLPMLTYAYRATSSTTTDGCNSGSWYNALLLADDALYGDGDLTNGTPHGCLIFQAFDAHGIACDQLFSCPSFLSAGPDRETCVNTAVSIGLPPPPGRSISWDHGVVGSPVSVVPNTVGTETYEMTARATGTTDFSIDSVHVRAHGCVSSLVDDFEGAPLSTWEMTGLWHHRLKALDVCLIMDTDAMYFGLEPCHYDTCRSAYGDLISDVITVPGGTLGWVPALSFLSRRSVELHSSPITTDRTEVWIDEWPVTATSASDLVWARSSAEIRPTCGPGTMPPVDCPPSDSPLEPWAKERVAPISLENYVDKQIRVRFHFDSLDAKYNRFKGWLIDDVEVRWFEESQLPDGQVAPTLTLVSPADGAQLPCCECATFEANAVDSLGNDISDQVVWHSDVSGDLGSGRGIKMVLEPTLPLGQPATPGDPREEFHTVTATVVDRAGRRSSTQFKLKVPDDGLECRLLSLDGAELRRNCAGGEDR